MTLPMFLKPLSSLTDEELMQRVSSKDDDRAYSELYHRHARRLSQKRSYWGWVATPAAAVVGIIFGMSVHLFMDREQDVRYAQQPDTVRVLQPVHDTLYLTQVVEKEKIVYRQAKAEKQVVSAPIQEEQDVPTCTSIQCDGINYSILAFK